MFTRITFLAKLHVEIVVFCCDQKRSSKFHDFSFISSAAFNLRSQSDRFRVYLIQKISGHGIMSSKLICSPVCTLFFQCCFEFWRYFSIFLNGYCVFSQKIMFWCAVKNLEKWKFWFCSVEKNQTKWVSLKLSRDLWWKFFAMEICVNLNIDSEIWTTEERVVSQNWIIARLMNDIRTICTTNEWYAQINLNVLCFETIKN